MRLILDANLLVSLVVPTPSSARAAERMADWMDSGDELFAPALWSYEATSAIRKFVHQGILSQDEAVKALSLLLSIEVQDVPPTLDLHRKALVWAERLNDFVAYDPSYLAVAEELEAPFWTTDSKLVKKARAIGIDWIYDLTEA